MRKAVAAYNFVLYATEKQFDIKGFKVAKNVRKPFDNKTYAEYKTVVVYETEKIKTSMFEHLWTKAKEL